MNLHPLAQTVCGDNRVRGVLHRVFDALCARLETRQFQMLNQATLSDSNIAFGHRVELRRLLVDAIDVGANSARQLQLRLAYSFYSGSVPLGGRSVLSAELRDTAFLDKRTFSPKGSEALAVVLSLPAYGVLDEQSLDAEPHVARLLEAVDQLDPAWIAQAAQASCETLCAGLAP